jgi:glycosyltransferase involved in cell wall biosynthesis
VKVVLIGSMYPPYAFGGAEKAIAMLAEALVRRGHNVVVVTLCPGTLERTEERNGMRVYHLPLDNVYWPFTHGTKPGPLMRIAWHLREMWNWKAERRVGRILDLETPDIVHTNNIIGFSVAVWRAVRRRNIRLVHTLHDYYLLCPRTTLYRRGKSCEGHCLSCRLLAANRKAASQLPDEIVSVSQFTLDKHKRLGFFHNVPSRVSYNIQSTTEDLKRSAFTSAQPDLLSFGFIGRIEPEKGIEIVLQATLQLNQPGWRLKIAGKGTDDYVNHLKMKYADERIDWLGFTTPTEFYPNVDVVVIPSQWDEPLGYVCIESLHEGKPLICARVGGLPEIAQLSKVVEYFPPGNAKELARVMNSALGDPIRWKRNTPPASTALQPFTEQFVVDKYLSAYRPEGGIGETKARSKRRFAS